MSESNHGKADFDPRGQSWPHRSKDVLNRLRWFNYQLLPHPLFSPGLTLPGAYPFGAIKRRMAGSEFENVDKLGSVGMTSQTSSRTEPEATLDAAAYSLTQAKEFVWRFKASNRLVWIILALTDRATTQPSLSAISSKSFHWYTASLSQDR